MGFTRRGFLLLHDRTGEPLGPRTPSPHAFAALLEE